MLVQKLVEFQDAEPGKWYVCPAEGGGQLVLVYLDKFSNTRIPVMFTSERASAADYENFPPVMPLGSCVLFCDHKTLTHSPPAGSGAIRVTPNSISFRAELYRNAVDIELGTGTRSEDNAWSGAGWITRWSLSQETENALIPVFEFGAPAVA